jgi:hypothetical protein
LGGEGRREGNCIFSAVGVEEERRGKEERRIGEEEGRGE